MNQRWQRIVESCVFFQPCSHLHYVKFPSSYSSIISIIWLLQRVVRDETTIELRRGFGFVSLVSCLSFLGFSFSFVFLYWFSFCFIGRICLRTVAGVAWRIRCSFSTHDFTSQRHFHRFLFDVLLFFRRVGSAGNAVLLQLIVAGHVNHVRRTGG